MFWQIVGAITFLFFLIEMQRVKTTPPAEGSSDWQAIIGRTIGDFLWVFGLSWIISLIIKAFTV